MCGVRVYRGFRFAPPAVTDSSASSRPLVRRGRSVQACGGCNARRRQEVGPPWGPIIYGGSCPRVASLTRGYQWFDPYGVVSLAACPLPFHPAEMSVVSPRTGRLLTLWTRYFRPGGPSAAFARKWLIADNEGVMPDVCPPAPRKGAFSPLFVTFSCDFRPTTYLGALFPPHGAPIPSHGKLFPRLAAAAGPHKSGAEGRGARRKGRGGLSLFGPILTVCQIAHTAPR